MTVGEFMRAVPRTITAETTMKDAVRIMVEDKMNGVIIASPEGEVAGILSSWDVVQLIVPDYLEDDKHLAAFEAGATFERRIHQYADTPVADFMTKEVRTVTSDDSLMQAATILSEFRIRQLPVVDKEGKLVGYLNRTDMKLAIAKVLGVLTQ